MAKFFDDENYLPYSIERVQFQIVKKRVKGEDKNEWGEGLTLEYTSGHRKRSRGPRWGNIRSTKVRAKRFDMRLNFRREYVFLKRAG